MLNSILIDKKYMSSFILTSVPSSPYPLTTSSCPNSPLRGTTPATVLIEEHPSKSKMSYARGYLSKPTTEQNSHSHLAGADAFPSFDLTDPRLGKIDQYTLQHLHPPAHPVCCCCRFLPCSSLVSNTLDLLPSFPFFIPRHSNDNNERAQTSKAITVAAEHAASQGLPDIATSPTQGKFLSLLAYTSRASHILEIGTLGGVSSIWLASLNPSARITTVEYDSHHAKVARDNLERAGVGNRVEVLEGAGLDVLPRLKAEIEAGKRAKFGFCFIDADKVNNWAYFNLAVEMCEKGSSIVVDNIVRMGMLVDDAYADSEGVRGAREVIEKAGKDKRVESVVLQICGEKSWDGFLLGVVL